MDRYGPLPPNDSSFRALCMLLAQTPAYENVPLRRAADFLATIQRQQNFCGFSGNTLSGVVLWREVSGEVAVKAVRERRMPGIEHVVDSGEGVVATAFIAPAPDQVRPLWDRFVAHHLGRIVLFERHAQGRPPRFLWVDRRGKLLGREL